MLTLYTAVGSARQVDFVLKCGGARAAPCDITWLPPKWSKLDQTTLQNPECPLFAPCLVLHTPELCHPAVPVPFTHLNQLFFAFGRFSS